MKQIKNTFIFSLALLLFALCNSSCDSLDGDWDTMEWQKVVTEKVKANGESCYLIPIQGGTYQFKCKNYESFWISHARILGSPLWNEKGNYIYPETGDGIGNTYQNLSAEGIRVSIEGNTVNVIFDENQSFAKFVEVTVTAGDIFDTFRFVQDSPLYTN